MALSTGSLLAGRYEITAPVAVGGMGEVWQARDRVLGRTVAAKVLKSEFTGDPNFLARFRNEARHTAALSHPNIASVYDYGETLDEYGRTVAYLVMEFVEGQPLVTILHEEGRLPVDWTLHVLGQAADGLSAAHLAGVVHRDIKPGNLIVRPDGVVKLTDFGIAQARDAAPLTRTGKVVGTAQYLSPEQAQGLELTASSDVYSLGVVGYECLAGVRPFDGTSQVAIALAHINRPPPPLPADIPGPVRQLIGRALAKDPTQRFPDGGGFAEAIHRVAAGGSLPAGPATGAVAAAAATEVLPAVDPTGTQVLAGEPTGGWATGPPTAGARAARPLPPLQATPADDDLPPYDDEPRRRAPRWPWLVGALVLLVALAGVGYLVLSGSGGHGHTASRSPSVSSSSSASSAATVTVDTAAFIGQDATAVQARLTQEGLVVTQQDATAAQLRSAGRALRAGAVAGSTHAGETVPTGTPVVLYVARSAYTPNTAAPSSTTAAPTTTPARTTAPTTTTTTTATTTATTTTATTTTASTSLGGTSAPTTTQPNAAGPTPSPANGAAANGAAVNGATS